MRSAAAALVSIACAAPLQAQAHVLFDRTTLRQWVLDSAAIAVAEFEDDVALWTAPDASDRQDVFRVRVVETLAGDVAPGPFAYFPHAEGLPLYARGDRALVFLERTADRPEFAALAPHFAWHSLQGPGQEWRLPPGAEGEAILEVVRRLVAARRAPPVDARRALREHLVTELASASPRLRRDALVELMRVDPAVSPLDAATVAALAPFAAARALPPLERLALIRLFADQTGFDADASLLAMTREPLAEREAQQLAAIAQTRTAPAVRAWLAARPVGGTGREASAAR